ncbi:hypothetical protein FNF28_01674 [Cafeteria roenbergensis]|uniref:EF-hand domain-containing protein n=1 Tax=Cafeteria roenbergensis TaxID=33653 RepID=A0A5A8DX38_CAFRO|nr:hypothetical protein FNF28_01674 [Cafeteria roenbergensis]
MEDPFAEPFDVALVGTGLSESIIAAASAMAGLRVVQVDANDYYGELAASMTLEEVRAFIASHESAAQHRTAGSAPDPSLARSDWRVVAACEWQPPSPALSGNAGVKLVRGFVVSLSSGNLLSRGTVIDWLVRGKLASYASFFTLQGVAVATSAASATAVASNALEGRGAKADFFTTSRDPGSALMGFLSGKRMVSLYEAFRSAFIARGEGLSLHEFAQAVACSLPQEAIETLGEEGIAFEVVALFSAIDVNGDGSLDWEEFVMFVVEQGMANGVARIPPPTFTYEFSTTFRDRATSPGAPGVVSFCRLDKDLGTGERTGSPLLECFLCVENKSRAIRMLSPSLKVLSEVSIDEALLVTGEARSAITVESACFAPEKSLLLALLSDHSVAFWSWTPRHCVYAGHIGRGIGMPTAIAFSALPPLVLIGTAEGRLRGYDPSNKSMLLNLAAHPGCPITVVVPLRGYEPSCVVTAAVDRSLLNWDLEGEKLRTAYDTKGNLISFVAWHSPTWRVFAATSGAAHEVLVYEVHERRPLARISGHTCDVVDIAFVRVSETDRIVTVDERCNIRVWDASDAGLGIVRQLLSFSPGTLSEVRARSMSVVAGSRDLIVASRRLSRFTFSADLNTGSPVAVLFNRDFTRFVSVAGRAVSTWDAPSGAKLAEYKHALPADATCACWDDRCRKLIVGTSAGSVAVVNPQAGVVMKCTRAGDEHRGAVSAVVFTNTGARVIITAGWDRTVRVFDESDIDQIRMLRVVTDATLGDPTAVAVSPAASSIAVGDAAGLVRFFDFETMEPQGEIDSSAMLDAPADAASECSHRPASQVGSLGSEGHESSRAQSSRSGGLPAAGAATLAGADPSVCFVAFVADRPICAVVNSAGSVQLWGMPHVRGLRRYTPLCAWTHMHQSVGTAPAAAGPEGAPSAHGWDAKLGVPTSRTVDTIEDAAAEGGSFDEESARRRARPHPEPSFRLAAQTSEDAKEERRNIVRKLPKGVPLGTLLAKLAPGELAKLRKRTTVRAAIDDPDKRWWEHSEFRNDPAVSRIVSQVLARNRTLMLDDEAASESSDSDEGYNPAARQRSADQAMWRPKPAARSPAILYFGDKRRSAAAQRGVLSPLATARVEVPTSFSACACGTGDWADAPREQGPAWRVLPESQGCGIGQRRADSTSTEASQTQPHESEPGLDPLQLIIGSEEGLLLCVDLAACVASSGLQALPHSSQRRHAANFTPIKRCSAKGWGTERRPVEHYPRCRGAAPTLVSCAMIDLPPQLLAGAAPEPGESLGSPARTSGAAAQQTHFSLVCVSPVGSRVAQPAAVLGVRGGRVLVASPRGSLLGEMDRPAKVDLADAEGAPGFSRVPWRLRLDMATEISLRATEAAVAVGPVDPDAPGTDDLEAHRAHLLALAPVDGAGTGGASQEDSGSFFLTAVEGPLGDGERGRVASRPSVGDPTSGSGLGSRTLEEPSLSDASLASRLVVPPSPMRKQLAASPRASRGDGVSNFRRAAPSTLRRTAQEALSAAANKQSSSTAGMTGSQIRAAKLPVVTGADEDTDAMLREAAEEHARSSSKYLPLTMKDKLELKQEALILRDGKPLAGEPPTGALIKAMHARRQAMQRTSSPQDSDGSGDDAELVAGSLVSGASSKMGLAAAAARIDRYIASETVVLPRLPLAGTAHVVEVHERLMEQAPQRMRDAYKSLAGEHRRHDAAKPGMARKRMLERAARADDGEGGVSSFLRERLGSRIRRAGDSIARDASCPSPGDDDPRLAQRLARRVSVAEELEGPVADFRRERKPSQASSRLPPRRESGDTTSTARATPSARQRIPSSQAAGAHPFPPSLLAPGAPNRPTETEQELPASARAEREAALQTLLGAVRSSRRRIDAYQLTQELAPLTHVPKGAVSEALKKASRQRPASLAASLRRRAMTKARLDGYDPRLGRRGAGRAGAGDCPEVMPARFGPYSTLEVIRIRQLFEAVDADSTGVISLEQLCNHPDWGASHGQDRLANLYEVMEQERSGDVTLSELFTIMFPLANRAMISRMVRVTASHKAVSLRPKKETPLEDSTVTEAHLLEIKAIFNSIDENRDGELSMAEIREAFKEKRKAAKESLGMRALESVIARYDADDNKGLDLEEFAELMMDAWVRPTAPETDDPAPPAPTKPPPLGRPAQGRRGK